MFSEMHNHTVHELHLCHNDQLNAVISIHNLRLGPALGGCRFIEYVDENAAIKDAMLLAKGMSYKAALAHVPQGGGKVVVMKPKGEFDRQKLFRQLGQFIHGLSGRFITAMDSGATVQDMDSIRTQTPYVASSANIGDPSPATAQGVVLGIISALHFKNQHSLKGVRVAIQGLGHVGFALAEYLYLAGAKLTVCDIDAKKSKMAERAFNAKVVALEDIYKQECDIFSPCGLGGILNEKNIEALNCSIVAGCANNQLASDDMGQLLHDSNILYAPDYVINSGGLIFASARYNGLKQEHIDHQIFKLKDTLDKIFILSKTKKVACHAIANEMAEHILYGPEHDSMMEAI